MANKFEKEINTINDVKIIKGILKEFNEACEKRIQSINNIEKSKELETKKFGFIKECFENASSNYIFTEGGKKMVKRYINCIKENKDLSKMHLMYECVRKADKNSDINNYMNEAISMIGTINKKNYDNGMKKLGHIFAEAYIKYNQIFDNTIEYLDKDSLNESIEFVSFNKKTPQNLSKYNANLNVIKEYIEKNNDEVIIKNNIDIDKVATNLVKEFKNKYNSDLEDIDILKELCESTNKENTFNKYKASCMHKIREARENEKDGETIERLTVILEKVSQKKYNIDTVNNDIYNFIELTNCVK